jgi:serine/threonine protein kinase/tetratricopeptide (TPR) repeat protein
LRVDHRALEDLAASVADGAAVDWRTAEQRTEASSRRLVGHLRLVDSIARLHRSIPTDRVPALEDLAASIADGTPVDWHSAEAVAEPSQRRLVGHLSLVESIARLHRSIPQETEDDDQPGSIPTEPQGPRWGRLVLLEHIGAGSSCEVHRAWDSALHRDVALKVLRGDGASRESLARLLDEARRLARVRHTHVVHVYGAEEHDGRVGLWMEMVRGESLEQIVKARGQFGAREATVIGLELCAALASVHAAGLLHRDVKAQNVMREHGGRIVLMDFGTGEEIAGSNRIIGTPLYLAPEIFRGQKASVQSDLYSLSVLLFYLVTANFPVAAGSMEQLSRAHAHRQRQPLRDLRPDLPEEFVRAVERGLDSDPARRFRSAGEMEAALRESIDVRVQQPVPEARPPVPELFQFRWPRPGFALLTAAVLLALVTSLIVWTRQPPGVAEPSIRSLAVLPLVAQPASAPSDVADAMTEQLISTIAQINSLRPTSLASTLPFKGNTRSRTEIANLLGVDAVLDGELTVEDDRAGGPGRLRLDATLIAAGSGKVLWSGSSAHPRGHAEAMVDDIVRALAKAVNSRVTDDEELRLRQFRRTSPAAEEAYLQGRLYLAGYGPEPAKRALGSFQRAIELDSNHAAAHAGAALAYVKLAGFNVLSHQEGRASAQAEIRKAYESGEDIAEAHAADADIKFLYDWDWDGAEREYQRSLDLNPAFMHARNNYAQVLAARRRFDESLKISEETLRMDPQSGDARLNHGLLLYYKGDLNAAEEVVQRVVMQEPNNASAYLLRSRVAEARGRYAEGLVAANQAWRLAGNAGVNLRVVIIRLQALAGHHAEAAAAAVELEQAGANGTLRVRPRDLAYLYLGLGRTQAALDAFEEAFDERDPALVWLPVEPRVDVLRKEPRFQALLQKLGAP